MTLKDAVLGTEYKIKEIRTGDEELNAFLFTLGCYENMPITVVGKKRATMVVSIKDARYTIDNNLAEAILI